MILYIANGTQYGGEVQLTKAQLDALIREMVGTRNVAIMQKLITVQNRMDTNRPVRVPLTANEIATLRVVAAPIPEGG